MLQFMTESLLRLLEKISSIGIRKRMGKKAELFYKEQDLDTPLQAFDVLRLRCRLQSHKMWKEEQKKDK